MDFSSSTMSAIVFTAATLSAPQQLHAECWGGVIASEFMVVEVCAAPILAGELTCVRTCFNMNFYNQNMEFSQDVVAGLAHGMSGGKVPVGQFRMQYRAANKAELQKLDGEHLGDVSVVSAICNDHVSFRLCSGEFKQRAR